MHKTGHNAKQDYQEQTRYKTAGRHAMDTLLHQADNRNPGKSKYNSPSRETAPAQALGNPHKSSRAKESITNRREPVQEPTRPRQVAEYLHAAASPTSHPQDTNKPLRTRTSRHESPQEAHNTSRKLHQPIATRSEPQRFHTNICKNQRGNIQSPRDPYEPSRVTASRPEPPKETARHQPVTASHHEPPARPTREDATSRGPDPRRDEGGLTK